MRLTALVGLVGLCLFAAPATAAPALKAPAEVEAALQQPPADAARRLTALLDRAKAADRPLIAMYLGEQHRLLGQPDTAHRWFLEALAFGPGPAETPARLGILLLTVRPDASSSDLTALQEARDNQLPRSQVADRYALLAARAAGTSEGDALRRKADEWATSEAQRARIDDQLAAAPARAPEPGRNPDRAPPRGSDEAARLSSARASWHRGDVAEASELLSSLRDSANPEISLQARLLAQTIAAPSADPKKIGVLLPLTGRYASVAAQVREALLDGWTQLADADQLVFVDSGAGGATAEAALYTLVNEHRVVAVLGPLLSEEAQPVIAAADTIGVPLLLLNQAVDDPSAWPWVFQAWLTPAQQIDVLLDHAMTQQNLRTFAIFAPTSAYGALAADRFAAEVKERGGTIAVRVDYPEDARTHGAHVSGLKLTDRPPGEPWYDAIFVPDNANRVTLATAAIAFADISIGTYTVAGRAPVPLIGLSGWNKPELVTGGGMYITGAFFTDVYVPPPTTGGLSWSPLDEWRPFTERYVTATGRNPSAIEALASDAARVLATAMRGAPADRLALREALLSVRPSGTVSGVTGFDATTRTLKRRVTVLSVRPSGFVPTTAP